MANPHDFLPIRLHGDGAKGFLISSWSSGTNRKFKKIVYNVCDEETYLSDVGDDEPDEILNWSMDILATGRLPWLDHRFREFPKGSWRYKNRGQLIVGGLKAAFGFYSGDWKFYAERFRFLRYWSMPEMCEDCHCTLTGDASFTRLDADHDSFRPRPIDDFAMPASTHKKLPGLHRDVLMKDFLHVSPLGTVWVSTALINFADPMNYQLL